MNDKADTLVHVVEDFRNDYNSFDDISDEWMNGYDQALFELRSAYILLSNDHECPECGDVQAEQTNDGEWVCMECHETIVEADEAVVPR